MLTITIPSGEYWDPIEEMIYPIKETKITLEHSLVSISKWEAKFKKPYLSDKPKTKEETLFYIKCMTITQNVDPAVYNNILPSDIKKINDYISDPMTATTIKSNNKKNGKEIITSEIIYYWMISHEIPMECQKWHLNRLLTLIQVCSAKNSPGKKMDKKALMQQNTALNNARRAAKGTKG